MKPTTCYAMSSSENTFYLHRTTAVGRVNFADLGVTVNVD